jgi:hypothetical protein
MPNIPSPRQGECKPPDRIEAVIGHLRGTLYWLNHPKWLRRRRSNVDKQRRRLLAERFGRRSDGLLSLIENGHFDDEPAKLKTATIRASKLRTIAARLRGTK